MVEIPQLITDLVGVIVSAGVISGIAALADESVTFNGRKFLYTIGLVGISSLAFVIPSGGFTESNALSLFLEIAGASFIGNKLIGVANKLRA